MAEQNSTAENLAYQKRALDGVKRLSSILTSMSEATRLEQAMQRHEPEFFSLTELLQGCVQGYQAAYPNRQFSFNNQADNSNIQLSGSPELFAQMLDKIITNAVEFSQAGDSIELHLSADGKSLSIRNPGPLLPDNMQAELLDSMVSVRPQSSDHTPHLGLGLFVAKLIAEYHGAQIQIHNQDNDQGVEVVVNLR